ncbi:MAG: hypothetical protein HY919_02930 [Elusimicrobia bacterium]|nr:hypothetical protein [Elusimicrobiota bacterium]
MKIKLLLKLAAKDFFNGISAGAHYGNGILFKGGGINLFVDPFYQSVNTGLLQMSANPTDISGGVIADVILAGDSRVLGSTLGNLYMIGDGGNMYDKNLANNGAPTALRPGSTIANPANGLKIYQSLEGLKYLYYFRTTKIGRWNFDGPSGEFIDDWATGLTNTTEHPAHFFFGDVYFGNGDALGKIYSISGSGATVNSTVLTFPLDFLNTCLNDDGTFLVAAITKNLGDLTLRGENKILYWDTVSARHNKEWTIPDFTITAIKKFGNGHIAFCGRGMWYFDFYTKPVKIRTLGVEDAPRYGYPFAADVINNAVLFGGGSNFISSYGKFIPEISNAYFQPIINFTGSVSFIDAISKVNSVFIGTVSNKLYYWSLSGSGGTSASYPETVYFDLDDETNITRIDILLGEPLATGDRFTLQYQGDEDSAAADYGSFEFDTHGAVKKIRLNKEIQTNQLKLLFNFQTGNVKIKTLKVYGFVKPY